MSHIDIHMVTTMSARHGVKARTVRQQLWVRKVELPAGKGKTVSATCIIAREIDAPVGAKPIEWRLLTHREAGTLADATKLIDWYRTRWDTLLTLRKPNIADGGKVCNAATNRIWNGVVFNLGDFALTACQPRSQRFWPRRSLTMTITITAFERSPDGGKGLARDTRVRWALEEVGQPYEVRLVSFRAMKEPAHRALHPFGKIPTYEEGDLAIFESGAIVLHIAERHAGLLPDDANARARAITWLFAALNTLEPPILELGNARLLERDKTWYAERLPLVENRVRDPLDQLSSRLGDAEWLDGPFSAGDLMMVSVLLRLKSSGILNEYPNLAAYVARGEARPAYKRAFDAQLAVNAGKPPTA